MASTLNGAAVTQIEGLNSLEALPHMTEAEARNRADKPIISKETDPNYRSYLEMQAQASAELQRKFNLDKEVFYFKDRANVPAMKDAGNKITTIHNDSRAAEATVLLAQSKGWDSIKVSGHADFKREVWLQASMKGIEVKGYSPSEQDFAALEKLQNQVRPLSRSINPNGDLPQELQASSTNRTSPDERIYNGELIDHGVAPYKFREDGEHNYYMKIRDKAGQEQTIWGVDLGRAINESGIKVGEAATIRYMGKKPVTVEVKDMDKAGNVIGRKQIMTKRNTWAVERDEVTREIAKQVLKGKNVDQKTISRIDQVIKDKQREAFEQGRKSPGVRVFDRNAPRPTKSQEKVVERDRQRERSHNRSR